MSSSEGPVNFRPAGLLPSGASRLRSGLLFRSGLAGWPPADIAQMLDAHRIGYVFDLRSRIEVERNGKPSDPRWEHWPLEGRPGRRNKVDNGVEVYAQWYAELAVRNAASIARMFGRLADPGGRPCLLCCHAGKDRTGIVVALLLDLLQYSRTEIAHEHQSSAQHLLARLDCFSDDWTRNGIAREDYVARLASPGEAVIMALDMLRAGHGGSEALLREAGLVAGSIAALRARLLDIELLHTV